MDEPSPRDRTSEASPAGAPPSAARGPVAGYTPPKTETPYEETERRAREKRRMRDRVRIRNTGRGGPDVLSRRGDLPPEEANRVVSAAIRDTFSSIRSEFARKGEKFDSDDARRAISDPPKAPGFPFFIVALAATKDILDVADLTGVGVVVSVIATFVIGMILFLWALGKMGGWWWKKHIIKWLWTRALAALAVEMIPFIHIVPVTVILVLMTHYREVKIVKLMNFALEQMHARGILKYIR